MDNKKLDCGHDPTWTASGAHIPGLKGEPQNHTTGTAHFGATEICHPCAEIRERNDFLIMYRYDAYLSSDGKYVTTWTGGILATVHDLHKTRAGFGGERYYFRAKDIMGHIWAGNGNGEGMYCRLKRIKG